MDVITTVAALRERLRGETSIVLVPTMGSLHAGHVSLVEIARRHGKCVVTTIFVNRLQFEPGGDFDRYPRTMERDRVLLGQAGCDVVFAPDERELYPEPQEIRVTAPKSAAQLCGDYRPGHFEGVVTIVSKLFNIVRPQVAVFGSKDYQQLHVIRTLVRQLNFGIEIVAAPTVREPDGLALSSRNTYLSPADRQRAPGLNQALRAVKQAIEAGQRGYVPLLKTASEALDAAGWRVDYVELRDRATLEPPIANERELVVLGAAWLGKTRLIDNLEIN